MPVRDDTQHEVKSVTAHPLLSGGLLEKASKERPENKDNGENSMKPDEKGVLIGVVSAFKRLGNRSPYIDFSKWFSSPLFCAFSRLFPSVFPCQLPRARGQRQGDWTAPPLALWRNRHVITSVLLCYKQSACKQPSSFTSQSDNTMQKDAGCFIGVTRLRGEGNRCRQHGGRKMNAPKKESESIRWPEDVKSWSKKERWKVLK